MLTPYIVAAAGIGASRIRKVEGGERKKTGKEALLEWCQQKCHGQVDCVSVDACWVWGGCVCGCVCGWVYLCVYGLVRMRGVGPIDLAACRL